MKRVIGIALIAVVVLWAQMGPTATTGASFSATGTDGAAVDVIACDNPQAFQAAAVSTTKLLDGIAGKKFYICSIAFTADASGTAQFVSGTDATCSTGRGYLTGPMPMSTGNQISLGSGLGYVAGTKVAADNLCVVMTGAGSAIAGLFNYVSK